MDDVTMWAWHGAVGRWNSGGRPRAPPMSPRKQRCPGGPGFSRGNVEVTKMKWWYLNDCECICRNLDVFVRFFLGITTLGFLKMLWDDVTPSMTCTPQLPSFEGKRQGCSVLQVDWQYLTVGGKTWSDSICLGFDPLNWPLMWAATPEWWDEWHSREWTRADWRGGVFRCLLRHVASLETGRAWQTSLNIFANFLKQTTKPLAQNTTRIWIWVRCGTTLNLGPFVAGAGKSCRSTRDDQDSTSMSNKAEQSNQHHTEAWTAEVLRDVASLSRLIKFKLSLK